VVTGLLDLSYAERPGAAPAEPVNLAKLLRQEAAKLEPALQRARRPIRIEAPDHLAVAGDARALCSLIAALLENAWRHGEGRITARLQTLEIERVAVLEIGDEGQGVPEALWSAMFERFHKGEPASTGAGLGLSIVKETARRMGGEARFAAPARLEIRLPLLEA
jgi:signal transduction histidine kinase